MKNQSTEDYIKAMYKLALHGKTVSTSALARELQIGDGSVTGMIKKLSAKKLVQYRPYRGMALTESGRRLALKMVRRHRLWEMFLVQNLGFSWHEVHREAEQLEHAASEEFVERLDRFLGFPKIDPHGDPIPGHDGAVPPAEEAALSEFDAGDRVRIVRVTDEPEVLQHAAELGLRLQRTLVIRRRLKLDGSMKVRVGSREEFISVRMAAEIFVRRVPAARS